MEDEGHARALGAHSGDDALRVRHAELRELVGRQVVRPRVEQLHHLRARVDLVAHVRGQRVRKVRQQRVQRLRRLRHHLLRAQAVLVAAALHHVRRQCPRRADEAQHRALVAHLLPACAAPRRSFARSTWRRRELSAGRAHRSVDRIGRMKGRLRSGSCRPRRRQARQRRRVRARVRARRAAGWFGRLTSSGRSARTASMERMGEEMTGPSPFTTSNSILRGPSRARAALGCAQGSGRGRKRARARARAQAAASGCR